jgi:hypothetical protein
MVTYFTKCIGAVPIEHDNIALRNLLKQLSNIARSMLPAAFGTIDHVVRSWQRREFIEVDERYGTLTFEPNITHRENPVDRE